MLWVTVYPVDHGVVEYGVGYPGNGYGGGQGMGYGVQGMGRVRDWAVLAVFGAVLALLVQYWPH